MIDERDDGDGSKKRRGFWGSPLGGVVAVIVGILVLTAAVFVFSRIYTNDVTISVASANAPSPLSNEKPVLAAQQPSSTVNPHLRIAIAVPVGGKTAAARTAYLTTLLKRFIDGGQPANHIYVFEDDGSRVYGRYKADALLASTVGAFEGVNLIRSHVLRKEPVRRGLHLSRHYKFMFDYLLKGRLWYSEDTLSPTAKTPLPTVAQHADRNVDVAPPTPPFDFVVVVEDDLAVADDMVKYFRPMAEVMSRDDSLFCVSGRADNAFLSTSQDPTRMATNHATTSPVDGSDDGSPAAQAMDSSRGLDAAGRQAAVSMRGADFDFRRGNHFMAPGFAISRKIYTDVITPQWMDEAGEVVNGKFSFHWDYQMDSIISARECIFPEVPRLRHMGGGGFSVSKALQDEMFGNLRLSQLPMSTSYGNDVVSRMTGDGYDRQIRAFIRQAYPIAQLRDMERFRYSRLIVVTPADNDVDNAWNFIMSAHAGVYGIGGYQHLFKQRGVHKGTVVLKWLTNVVLVVGRYSPFRQAVAYHHTPLQGPWSNVGDTYRGCFSDQRSPRDLPFLVPFIAPASPSRCIAACRLHGFRYAGVQGVDECWCGDAFGKHGSSDVCSACTVGVDSGDGSVAAHIMCGGAFANSVYEVLARPPVGVDTPVNYELPSQPTDFEFVAGLVGESCSQACSRASSTTVLDKYSLECSISLMPMLASSCERINTLMGCGGEGGDVTACAAAPDVGHRHSAPGRHSDGKCYTGRTMHLRCDAPPIKGYKRACVCRKVFQ
jgi:hypothetical protein